MGIVRRVNRTKDIVMVNVKLLSLRRTSFAAPLNHLLADINSDESVRSHLLHKHLNGDTACAAAEIETYPEQLAFPPSMKKWQAIDKKSSAFIQPVSFVGGTSQSPVFDGRQWRIKRASTFVSLPGS